MGLVLDEKFRLDERDVLGHDDVGVFTLNGGESDVGVLEVDTE